MSTKGRSMLPNILWIITDDQPRHTLGKMPKVWDRLVKKGIRFTKSNMSVPLCGPSRASIFTSMYVHNHTVTSNNTMGAFNDLGLDADTIATRMQAAGYKTGLFGKYLNGYPTIPDYRPPGWSRWCAEINGDDRLFNIDGTVQNITDKPTDQTSTDFLNGFLNYRVKDGLPFFAVFAPTAPHSPYEPSAAHAHDYDGVTWNPPALNEEDMSDKPSWLRTIDKQDPAYMQRVYEGKLEELQDLDDQIGTILDTLYNNGQLANTWIFFVTDNGFMLGEHRLFLKEQPYEECVGSPWIVRGPGVTQGATSGKFLTTVDLMPTTLEIAGLDPDAGRELDGRSFYKPITTSDWSTWRTRMLTEHPKNGWAHLREGDTVLVDHYSAGEQELYDLAVDPNQMNSIHATTDTTAMTQRLTALRTAKGKALRQLEV